MLGTALAITSLVLALVPALLYVVNVCLYRVAPAPSGVLPAISVLIPARNEERSIADAVQAALASRGIEFEVIVLDDHSEDRTAAVVADLARKDNRVRLIASGPLPAGWSGKQFACQQLAGQARHPLLAFIDADVRLAPDGLARLATFIQQARADLVSGIPRQEMITFWERLILPLVYFLLLSYLPLFWMRLSRHPAFGAGCGQLFLTRRDAYEKAGGHAAVRRTFHDGVTLPRAYRRAGLRTDLCDATDLAVCRMYRGGRELWRGLAKNACEGLAHPKAIGPWTVLLFGGQVLPFVLLAGAHWLDTPALTCAGLAAALPLAVRLDATRRFRQSWVSALLHPVGVFALLVIQWYALIHAMCGRPVAWKGRTQPATKSVPQ